MILRFFLRIIYFFLKQLVLLCQAIYFPFTTVKGKDHLRFKGPGIIISNHPNTLLDPLHVVSRTPRQSFFLANASLFSNPIAGFLLRYLYCIPIYRPGIDKDKSGQKVDNDKSFADTYAHLEKGGVIYIAPEGGSYVGRRLRPLKTGTARIALGLEARHNFSIGLHIYPVGLNYEHPDTCGSRLYIEAGEPIRVADWQAAYEKDPVEAARDFTDYIAARNRQLLIDTVDEEEEQLLYRLERILQHDEPLPVDQHYERSQRLLAGIKTLAEKQAPAYSKLQTEAAAYRKGLRDAAVTDRGISQRTKSPWTPITLLGWPVWLYGRTNNIFTYEIPCWIERSVDIYVGYKSTVKILSALFTFPLFYFFQFKLVQLFTSEDLAWWYLLSLPISGMLAWGYAYRIQPRLDAWRWRKWAKQEPDTANRLLAQREALNQTIQKLLAS
ncbi:MAG: 1-acyl-sn-glycerol-3-phosphate acyltransferase [Bacteroidota bacterium]